MPCYLRNMRVFFRMKRYKRMRLLVGLVSFWCAALAAGAGTAEPGRGVTVGLFWNKAGLPAVFPLLIDSAEGQDYEVLLSDAHSGADAMAAGLQGGRPLRLLEPPGEQGFFLDAGQPAGGACAQRYARAGARCAAAFCAFRRQCEIRAQDRYFTRPRW